MKYQVLIKNKIGIKGKKSRNIFVKGILDVTYSNTESIGGSKKSNEYIPDAFLNGAEIQSAVSELSFGFTTQMLTKKDVIKEFLGEVEAYCKRQKNGRPSIADLEGVAKRMVKK
jgi:hypothetical protein